MHGNIWTITVDKKWKKSAIMAWQKDRGAWQKVSRKCGKLLQHPREDPPPWQEPLSVRMNGCTDICQRPLFFEMKTHNDAKNHVINDNETRFFDKKMSKTIEWNTRFLWKRLYVRDRYGFHDIRKKKLLQRLKMNTMILIDRITRRRS